MAETNSIATGTENPVATEVVDTSTQNEGGEVQGKTFTASEVETIVKARLDRERKKLASTTVKPTPKDDDYKAQMQQRDEQIKSLEQKLNGFKVNNLRSTVASKLAALNCNDPDLLADYVLSKKLVHYDEATDEVVAENVENNLDALLRGELQKRPHLVKPTAARGIGSKAPKFEQGSNDLKSMSTEEFEDWKASKGITKGKNTLR